MAWVTGKVGCSVRMNKERRERMEKTKNGVEEENEEICE